MTHLKSLLFLLISPLISFSQWMELGKTGAVEMLEEGVGISYYHTSGPSPATGVTFTFEVTGNDWQSTYTHSEGGGDDYGCCRINKMDFVTPSLGCNIHNYQNFRSVYRTLDGGMTWGKFSQANVDPLIPYSDVLMVNDTLAFLLGNNNSNHAILYQLTESQSLVSLEVDSLHWKNDVFSMNTNGVGFALLEQNANSSYLFKTVDFGYNWSVVQQFSNSAFTGISITSDTSAYLSTSTGEVLKTTDGGNIWISTLLSTNFSLNAVDFYSEQIGYVVGENGSIFFTTDGGASWYDESLATPTNLLDVNMVDANTAYAEDENQMHYKNKALVALPQEFLIYPNPSDHMVYVVLPQVEQLEVIDIYNQLGHKVLSSKSLELEISNLEGGIYHLRVKTELNTYFSKLLKL